MELPENVTGIVADSAFSSPYDIIKKRIHTMFHCKGNLITVSIGIWSVFYAHYGLKNIVCAGSNERKYDSGTVGARNGRQ